MIRYDDRLTWDPPSLERTVPSCYIGHYGGTSSQPYLLSIEYKLPFCDRRLEQRPTKKMNFCEPIWGTSPHEGVQASFTTLNLKQKIT